MLHPLENPSQLAPLFPLDPNPPERLYTAVTTNATTDYGPRRPRGVGTLEDRASVVLPLAQVLDAREADRLEHGILRRC